MKFCFGLKYTNAICLCKTSKNSLNYHKTFQLDPTIQKYHALSPDVDKISSYASIECSLTKKQATSNLFTYIAPYPLKSF